MSILSLETPEGESVKTLGLVFDTMLKMTDCVHTVRDKAMWKVRSILRTQRYFDVDDIILHYKTRVLGYIEYRTSGIYHCTSSLLEEINKIQDRLLRAAEVTRELAFSKFNLAPLTSRRDMAMLAVIHRFTDLL